MRATKLFTALLCFTFSASFVVARAQVSQSATGSERHLWVGAELSSFHTDYNPIAGRLDGIGFYGDYSITPRIGLEGEVRLLDLNKPGGQTQKDFLAGPIFKAYQHHQFNAYGKILAGLVTINYPYNEGYGSYFAFAPGGGVEYRLNHSFKIRGEYEFQLLPGAPGYAFTRPRPSSGLNPNGFNVGIAYHIF